MEFTMWTELKKDSRPPGHISFCVPGGLLFSTISKKEGIFMQNWHNFKSGQWQTSIDVRDFIQQNYLPYEGDSSFLVGPTQRSLAVWAHSCDLQREEVKKGGVLDVDTERVSKMDAFEPGYIDKTNELVVGLQTDAPLKRGVIVNGGIRMAEQACEAYGYQLSPQISEIYQNHRVTHNEGVFAAYTDEILKARSNGLITGLPDAYGRGRIIGDYRRVALYGLNRLVEEKHEARQKLSGILMDETTIRLREELSMQINALGRLQKMAESYGFDITQPAKNAEEAFQWMYFAYLGAIKEENGAAMSLGRTATFLDIYIERDLAKGTLSEAGAQELVDQLMIKLRMARHLRTPDYNDLFAGDPLWVTEVLGGMGTNGRTLVTRTAFRYLQSLYNLGPAPEPNLTILWSTELPEGFKDFCSQVSIDTCALQYENDDIMRPAYGDDYAIACCVSGMKLGKDMQFFGARANLGKAILLAINEGRDEKSGELIVPGISPVSEGVLSYDEVRPRLSQVITYLTEVYVNAMNIIHYMHDKYAYESIQMALHDTHVHRYMAFGVAGLSIAVDSLSAIQNAVVTPIRNADGIATGFQTQGSYPAFGNDLPEIDKMAKELTEEFIQGLRKIKTYRDAEHTLSVLTITSNVMYGRKTGATPDGRQSGEPFAPGANPMHGRDQNGALAAMGSLSHISYDDCRDGISYTFSIVPPALGKDRSSQISNLSNLLDGYSNLGGHHINVNVLNRELLEEAIQKPEEHPQLTIRVSGYAVHFIKLTPEQQREVINRTFYEAI